MILTLFYKHFKVKISKDCHRTEKETTKTQEMGDAPAKFVTSPINHTVKNAIDIPSALPVV